MSPRVLCERNNCCSDLTPSVVVLMCAARHAEQKCVGLRYHVSFLSAVGCCGGRGHYFCSDLERAIPGEFFYAVPWLSETMVQHGSLPIQDFCLYNSRQEGSQFLTSGHVAWS